MDFELPEELAEVQKLARDFSEKEIAPSAAKDDKEHIFRKDLVTKMGSLGFFGLSYPGGIRRQRSWFSSACADLGGDRPDPQRHQGLSQDAGGSRRDAL